MRILFLAPTPFFSVRGTPIAIRQVLRLLSERGHAVDLLTFPIGEDVALPRLRIARCGKSLSIRTIGLGPSLKKAVLDLAVFFHLTVRLLFARGPRYDCVHSVDELTLGCWTLSWLIKCPVIYDMDSSIVEQFENKEPFRRLTWIARWIENRMIRYSTVVMPVCEALATRVTAAVPDKPCVVLPDLPNVDPGAAIAGDVPTELRGAQAPMVVYTGNLAPYQGVGQLLAAARLLQDAGIALTPVIVGGTAREVLQLARLYPRTVFLGQLPPERLGVIYRMAACLVSPRMSGTNTPMKVIDYMQAGRIIVATRLLTHTQVLDDSCAVLVTPTPHGLAEGIEFALSDEKRARRFADAARRKLEQSSSASEFENKLFEAYRLAMSTARQPRR